jgi:FAD/FMN-containing dehydrogenase
MKGIWIDPRERTLRAQTGVTWGEVDAEAQFFGYAVPSGIVSTTGVAGLTLGGGFGWLSRKYGFTSDNLLSADVVTADGQYLIASEGEHADLFWGLRGGGGNFGIVTSFQYRLQPVGPTVVGGLVLYPMERAADVIDFFREFSASAQDELGTLLMLRKAPAAPFLPPELHGAPVAGIAVCYAGPVDEGLEAVRKLKAYGTPLADLVAPKPFRAVQTMFDAAQPHGRHYYWKSEYLDDVPGQVRDVFARYGSQLPSAQSSLLVMQLGGAIRRFADDATAASHRDASYIVNIGASWLNPEESPRCVAWARDFWSALRPYGTGVYVNFLTADEGEERVRAAYDPEKYRRLVELKDKYDPQNILRSNQNIRPSA